MHKLIHYSLVMRWHRCVRLFTSGVAEKWFLLSET